MCETVGRKDGEEVAKNTGSKTHRFRPKTSAEVPVLQLVVYELLSLLRESAEPQLRERLIGLMTRIQFVATESDVAQALAEEDGEEFDDGTLPSPPPKRRRT